MEIAAMEEALNAPLRADRLEALSRLVAAEATGDLPKVQAGADVNNHIHTTYSFSPYSPTKAVWMAKRAGLQSAGIMDHDSLAGAREFIQAGERAHLATTIGVECRADCAGTRLEGRRINNPDQDSVAYMALHGIPHPRIDEVLAFFRPRIESRHLRNRAMVERINARLAGMPGGLSIDYDADVLPLSMAHDGGSVTERHLLFALAGKMIDHCGRGAPLVAFLRDHCGMALAEKVAGFLADGENPYYAYDLLGALKSDWVKEFYIPATGECPPIREVLAFADEIGAISAYAYLGDVGESPTGDKKAQTFEDAYLDLLFDELADLGFRAVTYMPPRNTKEQLRRVMALCDRYGLFQISGVDINSPRQTFVCEELRDPEFGHLVEATWALIGHERGASANSTRAFFAPATVASLPDLAARTKAYANQARGG